MGVEVQVPDPGQGGIHRRCDYWQREVAGEVVRFRKSGLFVLVSIRTDEMSVAPPSTSLLTPPGAGRFGLGPKVCDHPESRAVIRAIGDECLGQARCPLHIGALQHARFYRRSEARWQKLSRKAEPTVVFDDLASARTAGNQTSEVRLVAEAPVRNGRVL